MAQLRRDLLQTATVLFVCAAVVAPLLGTPEAEAAGAVGGGVVAWWTEWLAAFDLDGSRVDDAAEVLADEAIAAGAPDTPIPIIVSYARATGASDVEALRHQAEATGPIHVLERAPSIHASVPARRVRDVGQLDDVVAVEWDRPIVPALSTAAPAVLARNTAAGPGPYNGATAQSMGYEGQGMVIAVLDTGVHNGHDAFAGKWVTGVDVGLVGVPIACTDPADLLGHGTHVASIALGRDSGWIVGSARAAKLVEIQLIGPAGGSESGLQRALEWILDYNEAIDAGSPLCGVSPEDRIDVATLSLGTATRGGPNAGSLEPVLDAVLASGVVVTVSAGNCGPSASGCHFSDDENGIGLPANAAAAIAVAASADRGTILRTDDRLAVFSSRGPNAAGSSVGNPGAAGGATGSTDLVDRHRKPDLAAPGEAIFAASHTSDSDGTSLSGTSMSTPLVAGLAAILLEAGERAKSETGGTNLMRPLGSGFDGAGRVLPGQHPVREALAAGADYGEAGHSGPVLERWRGPGFLDHAWNSGWGHGNANATASLCWAWSHVLAPGGATPPAPVANVCGFGGAPTVSFAPAFPPRAGSPIPLHARVAGGTPGTTIAWDLDGDGAFDDAAGTAAGWTPPSAGAWPIAARVTDATGASATYSATIEAAPRAIGITLRSWSFDTTPTCTDTSGWRVDHEAGGPGWSLRSGGAHTPSCAWTNADFTGFYVGHMISRLTSPAADCLVVPADHERAELSFHLAGEIDPFEKLTLEISEACGSGSWSPALVVTGKQGDLAHDPPIYEEFVANLTAKIGQPPFEIRFRVHTFANHLCSNQPICAGYRLDTVALHAVPIPP